MIFGMPTQIDLPENATPLEAVAVVKYIDADGIVGLSLITTSNLTSWECVGMLRAAETSMNWHLQDGFNVVEDDDDE